MKTIKTIYRINSLVKEVFFHNLRLFKTEEVDGKRIYWLCHEGTGIGDVKPKDVRRVELSAADEAEAIEKRLFRENKAKMKKKKKKPEPLAPNARITIRELRKGESYRCCGRFIKYKTNGLHQKVLFKDIVSLDGAFNDTIDHVWFGDAMQFGINTIFKYGDVVEFTVKRVKYTKADKITNTPLVDYGFELAPVPNVVINGYGHGYPEKIKEEG